MPLGRRDIGKIRKKGRLIRDWVGKGVSLRVRKEAEFKGRRHLGG